MESAMTAATNIKTSPEATHGTKPAHQLSAEVIAKLRSVSILSSLKDEELHCLGELEELHLSEGDIVIHQGEATQFFYILLAGKLDVVQTAPDGASVHLASIPPGSAFGELPLLANMANPASIQAASPCHLIRFDEE